MGNPRPPVADVFSVREIAQVAGVRPADVRALISAGAIPTIDGRYIGLSQAIRAVRWLQGDIDTSDPGDLFQSRHASEDHGGLRLLASGVLHAAILGSLAILTSLGVMNRVPVELAASEPVRLVFLTTPGPGGGGGGGGKQHLKPPPPAALKGQSKLRSPVVQRPTVRTETHEVERPVPPPTPAPVEHPVEPPPVEPKPVPPVVAPVATVAADARDQQGIAEETTTPPDSQGRGSGGGSGSGQGTGMGEGSGPGIGPGSGGGTGGGPYRPGTGITPPGLLREIKPDYTEEARRHGLEGDVLVEIVVRRDGTVGDVKLLHGLGSGLDQRAIDAVRQWRFSPARRFGTPVDVIVEVAVEFKLR